MRRGGEWDEVELGGRPGRRKRETRRKDETRKSERRRRTYVEEEQGEVTLRQSRGRREGGEKRCSQESAEGVEQH